MASKCADAANFPPQRRQNWCTLVVKLQSFKLTKSLLFIVKLVESVSAIGFDKNHNEKQFDASSLQFGVTGGLFPTVPSSVLIIFGDRSNYLTDSSVFPLSQAKAVTIFTDGYNCTSENYHCQLNRAPVSLPAISVF